MTIRWVVDVDARGGYRVAEEGGRFATETMPLAKAEKALARLRERDAKRAAAARVEAGHRLARARAAAAAKKAADS